MSRCMECGRKDCCGGLIEEQLKAKEEECERYEKFINGIIYQSDIKMQNYMVQTVYDRLNKECKDFMDKQKGA